MVVRTGARDWGWRFESVPTQGLPESFDSWILLELGVVGQEGHFFGQALGDKDAVEGIAVVKRKVDRPANVAPLNGKGAGHAVVDPFFS